MRRKIPAPVGYAILILSMIASATIPSLTIIDPKTFLGIANMSIPEGTPPNYFGSLPEEPVFKAIIKNGGQIVIAKELPDSSIDIAAGLWVPDEGAVMLLIDDFSYQSYLETLKHEAIHMAQSCSNFGLKAESVPIGLKITNAGMRELKEFKYTNPDYYNSQIEREAYSHQSRPNSFIVDLLDRHCGSKPWIPSVGRLKATIQTLFLPPSLKP